MAIFAVDEVEEWVDDGATALCPHCGVDAVLGSACGFPIVPSFLRDMNDQFF